VVLEPRPPKALGLLAVLPKGLAVDVLPKSAMVNDLEGARECCKKKKRAQLLLNCESWNWRSLSRDIGQIEFEMGAV
jgi:hypothetical protein